MTNGVYSAPTVSTRGEWLGVGGAGTPTAVRSFVAGVFYPDNNQSGTVGTLGYCEYKTEGGQALNMRYRPGGGSTVSVTLKNLENWKQYTSGLGLVLYECTDAQANACAFSES